MRRRDGGFQVDAKRASPVVERHAPERDRSPAARVVDEPVDPVGRVDEGVDQGCGRIGIFEVEGEWKAALGIELPNDALDHRFVAAMDPDDGTVTDEPLGDRPADTARGSRHQDAALE